MLKTTGILKRQFKPLKTYNRCICYPPSFSHYLKNQPATRYSKLYNGVTIATAERDSCAACVGLFIDAGSRYESKQENGSAHFFEHIAFKSTNKRNKQCLLEHMESLGSRFKSIVTRELVAFYVECLSQDVPLATDVLVDCVFNNALDMAEIENQKKVIYSEMLEHDKDPGAVVMDYLYASAFQGTPLAQSVMGPSSNLYHFSGPSIGRYLSKCFDPCRTVLAAAGGVSHEQMTSLANCFLGGLEPIKCLDVSAHRYTGSEVRYRDDTMPAAHVIVAVEAPCLSDDERVAMEVARLVLGGWDRSQPAGEAHPSRVAREASSGLCDSYHTFNIAYKDCGLFGVHYVSDVMHLDDMMLLIQDEFMYLSLCVTESEVEKAKNILTTKILRKMDSPEGTCKDIGKWTLYHGCRPELAAQLHAVARVTAQHVRAACYRYLYDKCPVVTAVGPTEGLLPYTRTRSYMWWLRT
ncbi:hypothetical protein PYW07_000020 [Mythimna separata]|uniref:Mitochondrial processing peptidase beta subunit n=1 Tax=Mythimna separata TaxID=271217 RepID=A0AAD8E0R2_MYTSE|nr:hypothetical protein PYW07_000020 [Mythimna separata]